MNLNNYASQPGPRHRANDGSVSGQGLEQANHDEMAA